MTRDTMLAKLEQALRNWRRRVRLGHVLVALSAAAILSAFLHFAFALALWRITLAGLAIAIGSAAILLRHDRRAQATLQDLWKHLNRILPDVQESSQLLSQPSDALSSIQRLQQQRLLASLENCPVSELFPNPHFGGKIILFASMTLLSLLSIAFVPPHAGHSEASPNATFEAVTTYDADSIHHAIAVDSVILDIVPPAYTQLPQSSHRNLGINTVEGARVTWRIHSNQELSAVKMIFSDGDTLTLSELDARTFRAQKVLQESGFYHLWLMSAHNTEWHSPYFPIEVRKDLAPQVTILAPPARTELQHDQPWHVPVRVAARDDYRVTDAFLLATVSSGAGEGVKFREDTLRFDQRTATATGLELSRSIDLQQLKMAPGDELYFHVELLDNKTPIPNRARSGTRFVSIVDTAQTRYASSEGIAVNLVPDYFRSQRQIIIDTIKLIEERDALPEREFKSRSNALGFDQKALRLRYGQFLGEESESNIGIANEVEATEDDHDHAGNENQAIGGVFDIFDENGQLVGSDIQSDPLLADLVHFHDSAEATTLFAASIRTQLKAALAAMWDAELHLRLFRPKEALPYEYQALRLLKNFQQKSRVYVKRIGFEPPPLEPDKKRLTGELNKIRSRLVTRSELAPDSLQAVRDAIVFLQNLQQGKSRLANYAAVQVLEIAGQRLARRATERPQLYLEALQHLRTLTEQLRQDKTCEPCLAPLKSALWRLLPEANAAPSRQSSSPTRLGQNYFDRLRGGQ